MDLGIMQGRLVPKYKGRYQAFPMHYWQAEFHAARELGLSHVEFILDFNDWERNPLLSNTGIDSIKETVQESGVSVRSVCADYFMEARFHSTAHRDQSIEVLRKLIIFSAALGVRDIVIPCVDQSSLKTEADKVMLVESLKKVVEGAARFGIRLNLETDLAPEPFRELLDRFEPGTMFVNYDIGNSASLGFDPEKEFEMYGKFISDVHVKDRVLGGTTVKLGTGNANIDRVFSLLKSVGFRGNVVMQASRAPNFADEHQHVLWQAQYTRQIMSKYFV